MQKLILACLVMVLAGVAMASEGIEWREAEPFSAILEEAERTNTPILIDFYTTWCGPCKKLDKQVWADPKVKAFAEENFIPVKIDCEKGEGIQVAKANKIFSYPNVVFLNPNGTERDRFVGFRPVEPAMAFMADMAANRNTTSQMMAKIPPTSEDLDAVMEIGSRLTDQARPEASAYLHQVLKLDAHNENEKVPRTLLILADLSRKTEDWGVSIEYVNRVIHDYPQAREMDKALSLLAYYEEKAGNNEGAVAAQRELLVRHPDDARYLNAFAWFCAKRHLNLEEATDAAKKGVEVSNQDPGILDTLAEVYYARGMYADAISTMALAMEKGEPGDSYFRDQMEKFKKAQGGS